METLEAMCSCGATFKVQSRAISVKLEKIFDGWQEMHKTHEAKPSTIALDDLSTASTRDAVADAQPQLAHQSPLPFLPRFP